MRRGMAAGDGCGRWKQQIGRLGNDSCDARAALHECAGGDEAQLAPHINNPYTYIESACIALSF
jgi:hypothetical protein